MGSNIHHFPDISIVDSGFSCKIKFDRFSENFERAQERLGAMVAFDCKAYIPLQTGGLRQRTEEHRHLRYSTEVNKEGTEVVFPGPYARYLYMGEVMVDPDTGSPWAKEGATKVLGGRPLTFSQPGARDHWFDAAKADNGEHWIKEVKRIAGGGKIY